MGPAAYWGCTAVQVLAVAAEAKLPRQVSKVAMMPLLASWARSRQAPPLTIAALTASAAGDVLLEDDRLVLPGMAAFATAHSCYIKVLLDQSNRRSWREVAAYGLAWATLVATLRPEKREQLVPGAAYALLLATTAVTSSWHSRRAALGGAAFLVSDALIALRLSGRDFPGRAPLVMSSYALGQYLLASATLD